MQYCGLPRSLTTSSNDRILIYDSSRNLARTIKIRQNTLSH
ncbi:MULTISPECIES: hypothetical protein [Helicobacter]|nr:hypothetical protein [Helicobacter sp. UBA3407]